VRARRRERHAPLAPQQARPPNDPTWIATGVAVARGGGSRAHCWFSRERGRAGGGRSDERRGRRRARAAPPRHASTHKQHPWCACDERLDVVETHGTCPRPRPFRGRRWRRRGRGRRLRTARDRAPGRAPRRLGGRLRNNLANGGRGAPRRASPGGRRVGGETKHTAPTPSDQPVSRRANADLSYLLVLQTYTAR